MDTGRDAMRLSPDDNVATALRAVEAGEAVRFGGGEAVLARDPIPLCHKIALRPIRAGEAVLKYGQPIGEATCPVEAGRHVHVHNMRSARAAAPEEGRRGGRGRAPGPGGASPDRPAQQDD